MTENKMVSIIVPVYQSEQFIEECVNSILKQTYSNIEIILINDGSTDDSLFICEKLAVKDTRIVVRSQENRGVATTRNLGLSQAKGDYIYFVDSDDTIKPETIETLVKGIEKNNSEICVCGYESVSNDRNDIFLPNSSRSIYKKVFFENEVLVLYDNSILFNIGTKLYKKSIIDKKHILFNENVVIYEDIRFFMEYVKYCETIQMVKKALYIYNLNNTQSITHQYKPDFWSSTLSYCHYLLQNVDFRDDVSTKMVSAAQYRAFLQECHNPNLTKKDFFESYNKCCIPIAEELCEIKVNWETIPFDQRIVFKLLLKRNKRILWILALMVSRRGM